MGKLTLFTATMRDTGITEGSAGWETIARGEGSRGRAREGQGGNNDDDELHLVVSCLNECGSGCRLC